MELEARSHSRFEASGPKISLGVPLQPFKTLANRFSPKSRMLVVLSGVSFTFVLLFTNASPPAPQTIGDLSPNAVRYFQQLQDLATRNKIPLSDLMRPGPQQAPIGAGLTDMMMRALVSDLKTAGFDVNPDVVIDRATGNEITEAFEISGGPDAHALGRVINSAGKQGQSWLIDLEILSELDARSLGQSFFKSGIFTTSGTMDGSLPSFFTARLDAQGPEAAIISHEAGVHGFNSWMAKQGLADTEALSVFGAGSRFGLLQGGSYEGVFRADEAGAHYVSSIEINRWLGRLVQGSASDPRGAGYWADFSAEALAKAKVFNLVNNQARSEFLNATANGNQLALKRNYLGNIQVGLADSKSNPLALQDLNNLSVGADGTVTQSFPGKPNSVVLGNWNDPAVQSQIYKINEDVQRQGLGAGVYQDLAITDQMTHLSDLAEKIQPGKGQVFQNFFTEQSSAASQAVFGGKGLQIPESSVPTVEARASYNQILDAVSPPAQTPFESPGGSIRLANGNSPSPGTVRDLVNSRHEYFDPPRMTAVKTAINAAKARMQQLGDFKVHIPGAGATSLKSLKPLAGAGAGGLLGGALSSLIPLATQAPGFFEDLAMSQNPVSFLSNSIQSATPSVLANLGVSAGVGTIFSTGLAGLQGIATAEGVGAISAALAGGTAAVVSGVAEVGAVGALAYASGQLIYNTSKVAYDACELSATCANISGMSTADAFSNDPATSARALARLGAKLVDLNDGRGKTLVTTVPSVNGGPDPTLNTAAVAAVAARAFKASGASGQGPISALQAQTAAGAAVNLATRVAIQQTQARNPSSTSLPLMISDQAVQTGLLKASASASGYSLPPSSQFAGSGASTGSSIAGYAPAADGSGQLVPVSKGPLTDPVNNGRQPLYYPQSAVYRPLAVVDSKAPTTVPMAPPPVSDDVPTAPPIQAKAVVLPLLSDGNGGYYAADCAAFPAGTHILAGDVASGISIVNDVVTIKVNGVTNTYSGWTPAQSKLPAFNTITFVDTVITSGANGVITGTAPVTTQLINSIAGQNSATANSTSGKDSTIAVSTGAGYVNGQTRSAADLAASASVYAAQLANNALRVDSNGVSIITVTASGYVGP